MEPTRHQSISVTTDEQGKGSGATDPAQLRGLLDVIEYERPTVDGYADGARITFALAGGDVLPVVITDDPDDPLHKGAGAARSNHCSCRLHPRRNGQLAIEAPILVRVTGAGSGRTGTFTFRALDGQ